MRIWDGMHVDIGGLTIETPVIIASGVWPMDPLLWPQGSLKGVGAICSKGITYKPKAGNKGNRLKETPCGLLNSIGLQNGGIEVFVSKDLPLLASSAKPVIVNIAFDSIEELNLIMKAMYPVREMIGAVEMNASCPNVSMGGMSWGMDQVSLKKAVVSARSAWEGPLWVKLSPQVPSISEAARICESSGAQAVVVGNTWLGMTIDNEKEVPFFERVFAGLSGPAIFPLSLRLVWEAAGSVGIPVVGCGGIAGPDEALSMILAGASAVALRTGLFSDSSLAVSVCNKISDHMGSRGIQRVGELVGRARLSRENRG